MPLKLVVIVGINVSIFVNFVFLEDLDAAFDLLHLFLDLLVLLLLYLDSASNKLLLLVLKYLFLCLFGRHERETDAIGRHEGMVIARDKGGVLGELLWLATVLSTILFAPIVVISALLDLVKHLLDHAQRAIASIILPLLIDFVQLRLQVNPHVLHRLSLGGNGHACRLVTREVRAHMYRLKGLLRLPGSRNWVGHRVCHFQGVAREGTLGLQPSVMYWLDPLPLMFQTLYSSIIVWLSVLYQTLHLLILWDYKVLYFLREFLKSSNKFFVLTVKFVLLSLFLLISFIWTETWGILVTLVSHIRGTNWCLLGLRLFFRWLLLGFLKNCYGFDFKFSWCWSCSQWPLLRRWLSLFKREHRQFV